MSRKVGWFCEVRVGLYEGVGGLTQTPRIATDPIGTDGGRGCLPCHLMVIGVVPSMSETVFTSSEDVAPGANRNRRIEPELRKHLTAVGAVDDIVEVMGGR